MNSRNLIIGAIVVLILGGLGYFLVSGNRASAPEPQLEQTVEQTPQTNDKATDSATAEEIKEFSVESKGLSFTPKEVKVKLGDKVRVTFKNSGGIHDFTLDEFNVKTQRLEGGQQDSVEFMADKKGNFEYYCSVIGHRAAGMKGTLVVE